LQLALPWKERPEVSQLVKFWRERFPECSVEREGATTLLRGLRDRGVKRGLITNGQPTQRVKVEAMRLTSLLEVMVISEEVGMKKPDPRIFRMALERLGVDASEAVFVGDNLELDIAGMRAVWLNPDGKELPAGVEMVGSLEEILGLVGS
jgi:putative hydrolase of the HAD superfamily